MSKSPPIPHKTPMSNENLEKEKERLRFIIEQYFLQITRGCSEKLLYHSKYCCHNPQFQKFADPNNAAVKALRIGKKYEEKYLCSYLLVSEKERGITYHNMKTLVDLSRHYDNYSNIVEYIKTSFALPSTVNSSFKSTRTQDFDDETYFDGLDLDDINKIFNLLLSLNNDRINDELQKASRQLSNNLRYNASSYTEKSQLKPFIFLLVNPYIHDLENRGILANVFIALESLSEKMKNIFYEWFNHLSKEAFVQTLTNFEQFISVRILADDDIKLHADAPVKGACTAIQLLSKVNDSKKFVQYTDFYNDALNEALDLFLDYNSTKRCFTYASFPAVLNVITKGQYLQIEHALTQNSLRTQFGQMGITSAADFLIFKIRREHLIDDTLDKVQTLREENRKSELRKELKVHFMGEEGIDEGGVKREFFQLIVRKIFDPEYGMFKYNTTTNCFWFNPDSVDYTEFELIGIIIGLALYNNIILDVHFPLVIFKKLLNLDLTMEDIESLDPEVYQSFIKIKTTEEDVSDWSLYFCATYESIYGQTKVHNLKQGGDDIQVTNENRNEYLDLYKDYLLNKSISKQFAPFFKGFRMVCDSPILKILKPEELGNLVCGVEDLNFTELERGTNYEGGYTQDDTTIKNFWKVLHGLSDEDKRRFLTFVTGGDRVPYGGLEKMSFTITKTADSDRLPSAHTCFNTLILPAYPEFEKLRDLLTKALTHYEGFGLK
ncbi:hypothetical protein ACTFIV_008293 [Dictyostelium citrinum]